MPMRHATLRQLQVFEAAARHLSYSRAAAELHLTQPGVSMQMRDLEANAGMPLFDRIGRRMHLTEAGTLLLRHAHDVQRALVEAEDALAALRGLTGGRINLGVTSTAKYFAPQLLARFRDQHPALAFRLAVSNREAVVDALAGNAVDLAIMGRPPQALETVAAAFAPHPFVVIAAPGHPLARRRRLPVAALANESFLVREPGSGTRSAMQRYFDEHGVPILIGMEMASNETIKQAVMAGMGVAFISRHTIELELATKRLVLIDVRGLPVMREWFVVHLAAKRLSPTAQAFREFVLKHGRAMLARR
jgi:LysR family transcriptional regulator, low CO2-responsive transcriptional regulator